MKISTKLLNSEKKYCFCSNYEEYNYKNDKTQAKYIKEIINNVLISHKIPNLNSFIQNYCSITKSNYTKADKISAIKKYNEIIRYVKNELALNRILVKSSIKESIFINNMQIQVEADYLFDNGTDLEIVVIKTDKKKIGIKETSSNLELNTLFLFVQNYIIPNNSDYTDRNIKASYYYLNKDSDKYSILEDTIFDKEYFTIKKAPIRTVKVLCDNYNDRLEEFIKIKNYTGCNDICEKCIYNNLKCNVKEYELVQCKSTGIVSGNYNPQQEKIINIEKGNSVVCACAGTGKTYTLIGRVEKLLKLGYQPESIAMYTFTDGAVKEFEARIKKLLGNDIAEKMWISTFDKFYYDITKREYASLKKYSKVPNIMISTNERRIIIEDLLQNAFENKYFINFNANYPNCKGLLTITNVIYGYIDTLDNNTNIDSISNKVFEKYKNFLKFVSEDTIVKIINLYPEYRKILVEKNLITYKDNVDIAKNFLYPEYLEYNYGFKHIIIDEFQDTDVNQLQVLKAFQNSAISEMVVGDDDQAIYGFRGVFAENIINFKNIFQNVTELTLNANYRSTIEIVDFNNKIVLNNKIRIPKNMVSTVHGENPIVKEFFNTDLEIDFLVNEIEKNQDKDLAVLAFSSYFLEKIAKELEKKNIKFIYNIPQKINNNKYIQIAVSLVKYYVNNNDKKSLYKYFYHLTNGNINNCTEEQQKQLKDKLDTTLTNINKEKLIYLFKCMNTNFETDEMFDYFIETVEHMNFNSIISYCLNLHKNEDEKFRCVKKYKGIVLSTMHSSKGLEWDNVYVSLSDIDKRDILNKGNSEDEMKKKEEFRRLIFVACTRAKKKLVVTGFNDILQEKNFINELKHLI